MKPVKSLIPVANWLLRFATALIVYERFWIILEKTDIENMSFYFALTVSIGTITLLMGGLFKKNTTTFVSGIVIFGISVALIFIGGFTFGKLFENFVLAALGFNFIVRGN